MDVLRPQLVPGMCPKLSFERHATDGLTSDATDNRRRNEVAVPLEIQLLRPTTIQRRTRMQINPLPITIRQPDSHLLVPPVDHRKPRTAQQLDNQRKIRPGHPQIKIPMHPGLPPHQSIHTPPAIDPNVSPRLTQYPP